MNRWSSLPRESTPGHACLGQPIIGAKREGRALSFYYLKRRTSIVVVPVSSADAAFVFNEQTGKRQG
jgi:hypothetical protein